MKTRKLPPLVLGSVLVLSSAFVLAQDWGARSGAQATGAKVTWAELDADGDGMLNAEEATGIEALGDGFDEADADDDGLLTAEEYRDWHEAHRSDAAGADNADNASDAGDRNGGDDGVEGTDDGSSDQDPDNDDTA